MLRIIYTVDARQFENISSHRCRRIDRYQWMLQKKTSFVSHREMPAKLQKSNAYCPLNLNRWRSFELRVLWNRNKPIFKIYPKLMMSPTPVKILIEILSKSREQKARGKEGGRKKRVKEYKKDQLYSACARPTREPRSSVLKTRERRRVGFQG